MENQTPIQPEQFYRKPQIPLPNATAILVLGIISIMGCTCYGVPGLILGIIAIALSTKDKILFAENPSAFTPGSYSNLKAGRVCAIIGVCLSAIYIVFIIIYVAILGTTFLTPNTIFHHFDN